MHEGCQHRTRCPACHQEACWSVLSEYGANDNKNARSYAHSKSCMLVPLHLCHCCCWCCSSRLAAAAHQAESARQRRLVLRLKRHICKPSAVRRVAREALAPYNFAGCHSTKGLEPANHVRLLYIRSKASNIYPLSLHAYVTRERAAANAVLVADCTAQLHCSSWQLCCQASIFELRYKQTVLCGAITVNASAAMLAVLRWGGRPCQTGGSGLASNGMTWLLHVTAAPAVTDTCLIGARTAEQVAG
jgi:hypothetical protein